MKTLKTLCFILFATCIFSASLAAQCVTLGGYPMSRLSQKKVVDALYYIYDGEDVALASLIKQGFVSMTLPDVQVEITEESKAYKGLVRVSESKNPKTSFWIPETAVNCR